MKQLSTNRLGLKLINDYKQFGKLYIGVDFDDTIYQTSTGAPNLEVIKLVKELQNNGHFICLYTCREEKSLMDAIKYCENYNLTFDYINCSPVLIGTRKPLFNILLDDTSGLEEALCACQYFLDYK